MGANFGEIRALFSSKFLENLVNFRLKFRTFDIRNFAEVGENSKDCAKFRLGHRKIEEVNFRGSEISTKIRSKLTAISANFRKSEKQQ